jgi:hypothetical protein
VLALSQDALAEGLDEELSQALLDEMACLSQQVGILKANLPPINTRPTSKFLTPLVVRPVTAVKLVVKTCYA